MCTSPNLVIWCGKVNDDGKPKLDFIGKVSYKRLKDAGVKNYIQVPCGQCLECRIQQARQWADRVVLESKNYEHNYFVTLTYNEENLPKNLSLVPEDLSQFIQNVRNRFRGVKIKYFSCGEYGDISRRPHYHLILFNCPLSDLSYEFKEMRNGELKSHIRPSNKGDLKFSMTIFEAWNCRGMISVGEVTYDSAAYVSQYVTKKHKPGMKEFYERNNLVPEFVRMSQGIAKQFYEDRKDYLLFDGKMIVPSKGEAHISITPRYFDKLFVKEFGQEIFDEHIGIERLEHRLFNQFTDELHNTDQDNDNFHRDLKIKKIHKLRSQV